MQPIPGFDQVQAIHGRRQTRLSGGAYVIVIQAANEDLTGYGNQCLKVVYDVCEGEFAGIFADLAGDPEQNWRHEVEIDLQEAGGARLKTLVEAVMASNPGWYWQWDERAFTGCVVGLVLQERLVTNKKGKRKGQTSTYLDFWDAVPADAVRAGAVEVPPVNDQRDPDARQGKQPVAAPPQVRAASAQPVTGQQLVGAQPQAYARPAGQGGPYSVPQMPVPPAPRPQGYQQPQPQGYQQQIPQQRPPQQASQMPPQQQRPPQQAPQQQQMPVQPPQQQPMAQVPPAVTQGPQTDMYDEDIPF